MSQRTNSTTPVDEDDIRRDISSYFPPRKYMHVVLGPCINKWSHDIIVDMGVDCPLAIGDAYVIVSVLYSSESKT